MALPAVLEVPEVRAKLLDNLPTSKTETSNDTSLQLSAAKRPCVLDFW